jgi:hypothetical protein
MPGPPGSASLAPHISLPLRARLNRETAGGREATSRKFMQIAKKNVHIVVRRI